MTKIKKGKGAASKRQNEQIQLTDEQCREVVKNLSVAKMISHKFANISK